MKRKMFLLMTMISVLTFAGCGKDDGNANELSVGFFPNITHSQALIMQETKALDEKLSGICDVAYTSFNAGPAEVEALFADEIDIGYIGPVPAINANVKTKGDISILTGACDAGAVLVATKESGISSVEELGGKTVAIPQIGNTQHLCLLALLEEHGLKAENEGGTVNVVPVSNSNLQVMFERGYVDAALVPEPWGSIFENQLGVKVVCDYDDILMFGSYPSAVVVVRNEYAKENPDIVKAFLEVHNETTAYINSNMDEAIGLVNDQIEVLKGKRYDEDIIRNAFTRMNVKTEVSKEAVSTFAKLCLDQNFINSIPEEDLYGSIE